MKDKKKICITLSFPFPAKTGTPLHAMEVVRELKRRDLDVFVVQFSGWKNFKIKKEIWEDTLVYRIPFWYWFFYFIFILLKEKPDIIHSQHVGGAVNSIFPSKIFKIPLIYEAHSFWIAEANLLNAKKGIMFYKDVIGERIVFKFADYIVAMSKKMKSTFMNEYNVKENKLKVVYPGADFDRFSITKDRNLKIDGVKKEDKVIMYTGNFWPWQGIDLLLETVPYVLNEVPNVKYVLVGGNSQHIKEKKEKYKDYIDNVIFTGRQPHNLMSSFLNQSDVLVIPRPDYKINWTTPRKLGEYLTAGKPIVATDVGDHKLIIEYNDCGIVANIDPKDYAKDLIKALEFDELKLRKIEKNTQKVLNNLLSMENSANEYIDIYNELIDRKRW